MADYPTCSCGKAFERSVRHDAARSTFPAALFDGDRHLGMRKRRDQHGLYRLFRGLGALQSDCPTQGTRAGADRFRPERPGVTVGSVGQAAVDLRLAPDNQAFVVCMEQAGYPAPKADPEQYTRVARECLDQARGAALEDATYRACVEQRDIQVEVLPQDTSR